MSPGIYPGGECETNYGTVDSLGLPQFGGAGGGGGPVDGMIDHKTWTTTKSIRLFIVTSSAISTHPGWYR